LSVLLLDKEGAILECNKGVLALHGYREKEEIKGKSYEILLPEKERKHAKADLAKVFKDEKIHLQKYTLKRKDGKLIDAELSASLFFDETLQENFVVVAAYDIAERIQIEKEIEEYRNSLEVLVKERTKELENKNKMLEQMNKLFVGRELRMKELKDEIEQLKQQKNK